MSHPPTKYDTTALTETVTDPNLPAAAQSATVDFDARPCAMLSRRDIKGEVVPTRAAKACGAGRTVEASFT
jgi:hypothetical protein